MTMLIIFLVTLFSLVIFNVPIAFALSGCAVIMMLLGNVMDFAPSIIASKLLQGVDSYVLLAIPFFIASGEIMNRGGISSKLVNFLQSMFKHIRGGIGYCAVIASMVFAGVSGSAVADTTAVGSVVLPVMKESGYDGAESAALICSSGCIGPIIPPSVQMIIYGVVTGVSVSSLFMGGVIPGILIGVSIMVIWYFRSKKLNFAKEKRATLKEILVTGKDAIWAIVLPVVIMGSIIIGVATPTEASILAVVYSLFVGMFIYKKITVKDLPEIFVNSIKGSAQIMLVVGSATIAAYFITIAHIPELLTTALVSVTSNVYIIMILLNILFLLVGCVMDNGPAILILAPILLPVVDKFGLSPVQFGVVMIVNLCIGLLTPPVGNVLYVGMGMANVSMGKLTKALFPYMCAMVVVLLMISFIPQLVTFLPDLLGIK
jgi:tripartite ATP-independent transporter DctM subunit